MRNAVAVLLALVLAVTSTVPASAADDVESKIGAIPSGTRIEIRLTDKRKLRGFKGAVSGSSFKLVDSKGQERQEVAFAGVVSAKAVPKSHVTPNVIIAVAIGLAIVATVVGIQYARCGPLGCGRF